MKFSRLPPFLVGACVKIVLTSACFGSVIYDNLSSEGMFVTPFGANFPTEGTFSYIAEGFTVPVGANYTLTSFEFPISVAVNDPNIIDAFVMDDSGGAPGNVLESFQLTNLPLGGALTTVTSTLPLELTGGSQYWIAVTGGSPTTLGVWEQSDTPGIGSSRLIVNGVDQGWTPGIPLDPTLALLVNGDPVPEPRLGRLLAAGLIVLASFKLRSKLTSKRDHYAAWSSRILRGMMRSVAFFLLAALSLFFAAGFVNAEPIVYTESVTASGTLGSESFTNSLVTLTFVGDTSTVVSVISGFFTNEVGTATVDVASLGSATFAPGVVITDDLAGCYVEFEDAIIGDPVDQLMLATFNSAFDINNLTTSIGPITGSDDVGPGPYETDQGPLDFSSVGVSSTFTATLATPEPATTLVVGLGLAGMALFRRGNSKNRPQ